MGRAALVTHRYGPGLPASCEGMDYAPPAQVLVISRPAALSVAGAVGFLLAMGVVSFGIAGIWAALGLWLVLPFAGLEMLALSAALWWSFRCCARREVVTVREDWIAVERGRYAPEERHWFNRRWAQLRLVQGAERLHLYLRSGGSGVELGTMLSDAERRQLLARLRGLVGKDQIAAQPNTRKLAVLESNACS